VKKPLLVVDGDSLAHRAYHALPKSMRRAEGKPSNALVGFSNFLMRLWQAEAPRAVIVGWDTLFVPTYRHELFAGYQGGREFDDELLEQLDLLPELVRSFGFAAAKGEGYEADDFLAAAVAQEEKKVSDRRPRRTSCRNTERSKRCSRTAASRRRRRNYGSTVEWQR